MPATRGRCRRVSEAGQALIETAVVLPLILILLVIVVDFGIALDRREVILHSLREAGRAAAAGDTEAIIKQRALAESDGVLTDPNAVSVCYRDENGNRFADKGEAVVVGIQYEFKLSAGGGEMLTAVGISFPTLDISPTGEAPLLKAVPGATFC